MLAAGMHRHARERPDDSSTFGLLDRTRPEPDAAHAARGSGCSMSAAYRYSAWDASQPVESPAPEQVLDALADSFLSGNIEQALDRALHRGISSDDDETLAGLDHLRDQLRAERRALDEALADDESLRRLADALQAGQSGGDTALDPASSRLLEALAASPDAARILSALPSEARDAILSAIDQVRRGGSLSAGDAGLDRTPSFSGSLAGLVARMEQLDALESQLRRVRHVDDVPEIDIELVRQVLGDAAVERLGRLTAALRGFAASGFVRGRPGKLELSARALKHIGDELLGATLTRLAGRQPGDHRLLDHPGAHDLTGASREYRFGDPLSLDLSRTVLQAVQRGDGTPVRLAPADFVVFEREDSARAATVLAIDLSRSMGERGYLLAAKQLALALQTLVRTRFPRDILLLAGFSEAARALEPRELPRLTWDRYGYGTNIQEALRLARTLLAAHRGLQRNVILLTDGEPTAHRDAAGTIHFGHPPFPATLTETYAEANRLRRDGLSLCVCVLSSQLQVVRFARELTRHAAGDLIFTDPDDLASAVIVEYGKRRRR
jgi:Mg-chelatase subunit ChlD